MANKIEIGDIVDINFHASQFTLCSDALVLKTPSDSLGGYWVVRESRTGQLHYVAEACTITKRGVYGEGTCKFFKET